MSILVRVCIAVVACWFIFRNVDGAGVAEAFRRLRVSSFLLSLLVFVAGLCLIAFRWWVFMRAQGIRISLFIAIKLTYLGQFFTNFMPSAVGGDLIRAWYVSKHTDKKLQAALGVGADRIVGLISTIILAVTSYLIFMKGRVEIFQAIRKEGQDVDGIVENFHISGPDVVIGGLIFLGCVCIASSFFDLRHLSIKTYANAISFLAHVKQVIMVYVKYPFVLLGGLGVTIFFQSLMIITLWLIGRDLGIKTPIQFYFIFFPLMWVVGSLPLSIAGIGILEGGLVLLFVQFSGAEEDAATALALCQRFIWVLASLPGMVVHLTGSFRNKDAGC